MHTFSYDVRAGDIYRRMTLERIVCVVQITALLKPICA